MRKIFFLLLLLFSLFSPLNYKSMLYRILLCTGQVAHIKQNSVPPGMRSVRKVGRYFSPHPFQFVTTVFYAFTFHIFYI